MATEAQTTSGGSIGQEGAKNAIGNITANRSVPQQRSESVPYDSSSPEPTKRADMNSRSFKSAVTRASNYTQDNYHQVASATMAKAFGYPDIEKGFRDIERDQMRYGSLSGVPRGLERRDALEKELEKRVKRDYGSAGISAWNRGKS